MLENGYDADAWCGLYRYKLMWAITGGNADTVCGQGLYGHNGFPVPVIICMTNDIKIFAFVLCEWNLNLNEICCD